MMQRKRPSRRFYGRDWIVIMAWIVVLTLAVRSYPIQAATFPIAAGDVRGLIDAINIANANGEPDIIVLAARAVYTLTGVDNVRIGANGLPAITSEVTIEGNAATIERARTNDVPAFRIIHVASVGQLTLRSTIVRNGLAGTGGGLLNFGTLTLRASLISSNTGADTGDGFGEGLGGGLVNQLDGTLEITGSIISDNMATIAGGLLNFGTLMLRASIVRDNIAEDFAGGCLNFGMLTLAASLVSGNEAATSSGGLANAINATMILTNSTVRNNIAQQLGGGIFNDDGSELPSLGNSVMHNTMSEYGGDLLNTESNRLMLTSSTIANNTADIGGGLYNRGMAQLTNTTISGNTGALFGGGLLNFASGDPSGVFVQLINTTISNNTAGSMGGGGVFNLGTLTLGNSIVAAQAAGEDCLGFPMMPLGRNLDSDGTCPNAITSATPGLGPLAGNGGPTATHALLPGSPAIDAIMDSSTCPPTDQRGVMRPQGSACDLGAFEVVME